jgi:hypothetical protein
MSGWRRMDPRRLWQVGAVAIPVVVAALISPAPAAAHALVARRDLPIPTWLFAWAASLVLIVSFVVLSFAWRDAKLEDGRWRPVGERLSRWIVNPVTGWLAGALGVFLLGVVLWTSLYGENAPATNFSLTFVYVTAWLGLVVLSVLFGNVFRALNPWRALARGWQAVIRLLAGQTPAAPLRYPERLGRWPAVVGLVAVVWLELVWGSSGFQAVGLYPRTLGHAVLFYTLYTFAGMGLFGIDTWLERGEVFSVYFGMFSQLGPLEVRDERLGLRRPLSGAAHWATLPGSVAMVLASIGTTTFDGAQEGPLHSPIFSFAGHLTDIGLGVTLAVRLSESFWMAASIAAVAALYLFGVRGMQTMRGSPGFRPLAISFGHTLIPIALAYLTAHYFSLVFFQEQAQFGYLLSDPLGNGWDLFGTATNQVNYGALSANAIWYVQVGALIAGHVTGLSMAHDRAITVYGDPKRAAASQRWMLLVMVGFTCLGLFLLSQANG